MFHFDNVNALRNARDKCWVTDHRALRHVTRKFHFGLAMAADTKQRSAAWRFFEKKHERRPSEMYTVYGVHLAFKNSTGSMNNQLRWKHPTRWSETASSRQREYADIP